MPPASKRAKSTLKSPDERQPGAGSDAENQEEPQPGPSGMPPPRAVPGRRGYKCRLCHKGFYDLNQFKEHKRVIHRIAASVITVAPDQVSLTSEDAASEDGDYQFPMPSEAAPVQRRSVRTADARTAIRDATVDPAKIPKNARTKNTFPPAFNDAERAQSKKAVRTPKYKGV